MRVLLCFFLMKHLEFKYNQYTNYPCASKACASKVRVGNGFVAQVFTCGLVLRCIVLCCPGTAGYPGMACRGRGPAAVRSGLSHCPFLQGDVHRVVLLFFDLCPVHWPLASALCRCVLMLALPSGVDDVQLGVLHRRFAGIPVSECHFFARLMCRVLS